MAARIMGIVASARKGMNTDRLVSAALGGARSRGAEIEKIYLNDLKIMPCQACEDFPHDRYCWFDDGMKEIYRVIDDADAIVVGTPAYFGCFSAQLKSMIDRCNCLAEMTTHPDDRVTFRTRVGKEKKGIFIWVAHLSRDASAALVSVRLWCRFANVDLVDTLVFTGSDRRDSGPALEEAMRKAFEAGARLAV